MAEKLQPGDQAPDFALPAVDGRTVRLSQVLLGAQATVVLFICNHCPYVKAYIPRLIALQTRYARPTPGAIVGALPGALPGTLPGALPGALPGVGLIGICSNDAETYPDDSFENMKKIARDWGLNFPYLRDEDQSVARAYGAQRTPEIFVLDRQGVCRYEGGVDDHYQDESKATRHPLRDAVEALIAGRPVPEPRSYTIGCTIKWKH